MAARDVLRIGYAAGVAIAPLLLALPVAFAFGALGALIGERVLYAVGYPTTFVATGLASALAAAWTANLLAPDRSRTRLRGVLASGIVTGLVGAGAFLGAYVLSGAAARGPPGPFLLPLAALVAVVPIVATFRLRDPQRALRRDAWWTLGVLVALVAAWYGVIGIACALDACGA